MRRERGVAKSKQTGQAKQNIIVGIDWQPADSALSIYVFAIKPRKVLQPTAGFDFRERVDFSKITDKLLPVRVLPPLRFLPQQMNPARKPFAQRVRRYQRIGQPVRPRNHNPKFWFSRHR